MSSRLGPLVVGSNGSHVDAKVERGCVFESGGVKLWDGQIEATVDWPDVSGIEIEAPLLRNYLWLPFLLLLAAFSPGTVRMFGILVTIDRAKLGRVQAALGRPNEGPYRYVELIALDAMLEVLGETGRYDTLGDPDCASGLLASARAEARGFPGTVGRRVKSAVRARLGSR